jgi:hypothetical protein
MNGKQKFKDAFAHHNKCQRFVLRCRGRHNEIAHKYIGETWPRVEDAPDPTLINWENLGASKTHRRCCKLITNFFAVILLLLSFRLVLQIQSY